MADEPQCPHCGRAYDDTATMAERHRLQDNKLQDRDSARIKTINPGLPPDVNTYDPDEIASVREALPSGLRSI